MSGWPGSESADFGSDDHIDHIFRAKIEAPLLDRIADLEAALEKIVQLEPGTPGLHGSVSALLQSAIGFARAELSQETLKRLNLRPDRWNANE